MPRNIYKGKRSNVTFPVALFEKIEKVAERETLSFSQAVVKLCSMALEVEEKSKENNNNET
jgi:metal-responsive CopG/Arc/MetJ family transcriptional regulator